MRVRASTPLGSTGRDESARRRRRRRGFTLVEVAITVGVMALAIVTSITTLQRGFSSLDSARNISLASTILQTEVENERLFTWTKLNDATYQPVIGTTFLRNPTAAGRFAISRTLTTVPNHSGQMVQVVLTVQWRSYDGRAQSRSFTTYFTQGGLNDFFSAKS